MVQAHRHLGERHVEVEAPARDLPVPGVLDHADDGLPRREAVGPGLGLGPDRDQAPAHGLARRPQVPRERFADEDHGGGVGGVAVGEGAARDDVEPHRLDVAGRHGLHGHRRPLRPVGPVERLALEHHATVHADDPVLEGQQHHPARGLDPAQVADAGEELPVGGPPRRDLLVRAVPGGEGEREHAGGPVAEIDARQVHVAGREEAGPDGEDEGRRDLRDDERVAGAGSRAPRGRAVRAVAQPRDERQAAGPRRRRRGHREREPDGEQRGEGGRGPVHRGLLQPGHVGGAEGDEERQRRRREGDAARRRGSGDEQGLEQVGAEQAPAADAERALHRRVAPARLRPHDHQPGHVGAGDQQQERHAAEENEQGRLGVAEDVVRQGRDDRAPRAQPREVRFPQPRHDDVHLRPRLVQGAARRQATDRVEDPEAALRARVHAVLAEDAGELAADRGPHLGTGRELERGRHDADHRERLAPRADRHRRPDDVGVAVEVLPPRGVAQHHHALGLGPVLLRQERPAEPRPGPQGVEERRGDRADGQPDRRVILDLHLAPRRRPHRGHAGERPGLCAPVLEVRQRHLDVGVVAAVVLLPQDDELVLVRERQRLQKDRVDHREEPHGQPEAEGQGEYRGENETGLPAQAAERVAQILAAPVGEPESPRRPGRIVGNRPRPSGLRAQLF